MTPRTGRPTDDPKRVSVRIRLSESDDEKLIYCANVTGRTKADIIREGIDKVHQEIKQEINKTYDAIQK